MTTAPSWRRFFGRPRGICVSGNPLRVGLLICSAARAAREQDITRRSASVSMPIHKCVGIRMFFSNFGYFWSNLLLIPISVRDAYQTAGRARRSASEIASVTINAPESNSTTPCQPAACITTPE